jgi:hypothetical protein
MHLGLARKARRLSASPATLFLCLAATEKPLLCLEFAEQLAAMPAAARRSFDISIRI